ncbi:MAG: recombination regulator RecX [Legionella sp.]|nr:MAG: recombination regulator RecX [Legionella sp.]
MTKVFVAAVALLARREHGYEELAQKLTKKGFASADILVALTECQRLELQSDRRFVEILLRARIRQGYGPERVRNELRQKQVDRALLEQVLADDPVDWTAHALQVLQKKYKSLGPKTYAEQQKQKQFLLYRGFPNHTIAQAFEQRIDAINTSKHDEYS